MFGSTRDHFVQNVLPAYREFFAARRQSRWGENQLVRLGVAAAGALFHLREHLDSPETVDALCLACADFGLVRDVINAAKHKTLTAKKPPAPRISSATQIFEMLVSTRYEDAEGTFTATHADVFLELDDGSQVRLADILHATMTMWCTKLGALGVIKMANPESAPTDGPLTREQVQGAPLEIVSGEDRRLRVLVRRFDYQLGRAVPEDLTGTQIEMRVYKLPRVAPMHCEIPQHGLSCDVDLPLTEDEAREFVALATPEEQQAFAVRLVGTSAAANEALQQALQAAMDARAAGANADRPPA